MIEGGSLRGPPARVYKSVHQLRLLKVETNDSFNIALFRAAAPVLLIDGVMPTSLNLLEKASLAYWIPPSE